MEKMKVFYHNHALWISTIQYIVLSIVLLCFVGVVDVGFISLPIPPFMLMRVEFSQSILTALAAAFLTITTFTFSTILTVLGMYGSSFSPRVVENFIHLKITLRVLGIFIGEFFFCVGALFFTRKGIGEKWVIAGSIALLYSIVCVIYFIIFIQEVMGKFQGVNVIKDISQKAHEVIGEEVKLRKATKVCQPNPTYQDFQIKSLRSGYLSIIDFEMMDSFLEDFSGNLQIEKKIGEYVVEGSLIATLFVKEVCPEDLLDKIPQAFILQDQKIEQSDYRYILTKLLEIGLRALSPGINDPNTAIHCINKLGVLLADLATLDTHQIQKSSGEKVLIYYDSYSFEEDLLTFYGPLVQYGKEDLQAVLSILDSLSILYYHGTKKNKVFILNLIEHIRVKIAPFFETDLEKGSIEEKMGVFVG